METPAAGQGPGEEEEEEEEEKERAGDRRLCRAGSGAGAGRGRPLAARPQGAAEAAGARPPRRVGPVGGAGWVFGAGEASPGAFIDCPEDNRGKTNQKNKTKNHPRL